MGGAKRALMLGAAVAAVACSTLATAERVEIRIIQDVPNSPPSWEQEPTPPEASRDPGKVMGTLTTAPRLLPDNTSPVS